MTLEQIEAALDSALVLRPPTFPPDTGPGAKISALEDYLLSSALAAADLVEARHWLRLLEAGLAEEWAALAGWETFTTKPRAKLSKQDIQEAKIKAAPAKYAAGQKVVRLRASIDDQVARLEREERVVSRAYTMIAG